LSGVAVSPDGRQAYQGSNSGVAIFARDRMTGALSQAAGPEGCVTAGRAPVMPLNCAAVPPTGLLGPWLPAVSPDGRFVYVTAYAA
jgi:hypothetical protein